MPLLYPCKYPSILAIAWFLGYWTGWDTWLFFFFLAVYTALSGTIWSFCQEGYLLLSSCLIPPGLCLKHVMFPAIDQWRKVEEPHLSVCNYSCLIFDQTTKNIMWQKQTSKQTKNLSFFNKWFCSNWVSTCRRMKTESYL